MKKLNVKKRFTTIHYMAVIFAAIIVAGILWVMSMKAGSQAVTITTSGNYRMSVAPDRAVVYVLVQTTNKSADEAKNANAEISQKIIDGLYAAGIGTKDIQTENYNIYPQYEWEYNRQKFIGYTATNYIKITTNNFDLVGKIVDISVDNGGLVNYINFELSNDKSNEYKAQALAGASKDAKAKAEAIAKGLGKRLGDLVSVTSTDYNYYPYPFYRIGDTTMDVKTAATNIIPSNLDISASVSVTYGIR